MAQFPVSSAGSAHERQLMSDRNRESSQSTVDMMFNIVEHETDASQQHAILNFIDESFVQLAAQYGYIPCRGSNVNTGSKRRKRGSGDGMESRYLRYPLPATSLGDKRILRHEFYTEIAAMSITLSVNGRDTTGVLGQDKATEMTNFFFHDIFDRPARDRLFSIIQQYGGECTTSTGKGPASRSAKAAAEHSEYPPLAEFFDAETLVLQNETPPNSSLGRLFYIRDVMNRRGKYNRLINQAKKGDAKLDKLLNDRGFHLERGVGQVTRVNRYSASVLGIDEAIFRSRHQATEGFEILKENFGQGLFVLLPPTAGSKMHTWAKQRLTLVVEKLCENAPDIKKYCDWLDSEIYQPIAKGEPLSPIIEEKLKIFWKEPQKVKLEVSIDYNPGLYGSGAAGRLSPHSSPTPSPKHKVPEFNPDIPRTLVLEPLLRTVAADAHSHLLIEGQIVRRPWQPFLSARLFVLATMLLLTIYLLYALSFFRPALSLVARAALPPKFTVTPIGPQTSNFKDVQRDGGGGGHINGKHVNLYCDTMLNDTLWFVSNTATYADESAPEKQTDFGLDGKPQQAIPFTAAEEAFTTLNFATKGQRVVLWPGSSITSLNNTAGMFFANAAQYSATGTAAGNQYNTLVTVDASSDTPHFTRTLEQAFDANRGPLWGSFGSVASDIDGILLFANNASGMLIAKTNASSYADLSSYTYWNGASFVSDPSAAQPFIPELNPTSGDIFWSPLYNTWMFVYMGTMNVFSYRYALNGAFGITGPWSQEFELYDTTVQTPAQGATYSYAGHAYPGFDSSGGSVVLSWSSGVAQEYNARVDFS
ncbi:MAG: hypothetical protein M1820_010440 [Bogoriella megaspora]|nr:MAG: hypothetical protein M1820_010440 [Bogoriella megaspora]